MNQLLSKRNLLILAVLLAGVLLVIYLEPGSQPVSEKGPLTETQGTETLRAQFNQDTGKTRLIMLLSPT